MDSVKARRYPIPNLDDSQPNILSVFYYLRPSSCKIELNMVLPGKNINFIFIPVLIIVYYIYTLHIPFNDKVDYPYQYSKSNYNN